MNPPSVIRNPLAGADLRVWAVRILAVVSAVTLLALSASVMRSAVSGALNLVALLAIGAVGTAVFHALPWAFQRLENQMLKLRKAEARANPIEQLQNEVLRRAERLQAFRRALVTVGGQIESISEMLSERRQRDPAHVLDRQHKALQRLKQFHDANVMRLQQAQAALEEFRHQVEQKESEWRIALAIDDTVQLLDPNASDHLMQELLTDTALRSVQDRFNAVFAELDIQMRSVDAPTRGLLSDESMGQLDTLQINEPISTRRTP